MLFDVREAAEFLRSASAEPDPSPASPPQLPVGELTRSPVAARVGALAAADGLQLFHFEHRVHLDLPDDWVPAHDPELALAPRWLGAVLPERKYQGFRVDQAIGGFHPGMRAKWGTHELCHSLVGFAWRPQASALFIGTASRLSELLPVVLWYALDEVHLRRCELHQQSGSTFRRTCAACEACASVRIDERLAERRLREAHDYLERELAAIARTRATGRPVPHIYGSLDLCSDGVAYAAAHGPRMASAEFAVYADAFMVEHGGWVQTLDDLERRVIEVTRGLVLGTPVRPLAPSASHGRARWIVQDLAWRLLTVAHDADGEVHRELMRLVEELAKVHALTATSGSPGDLILVAAASSVGRVMSGYKALHADYMIPDPDDLFSLGYDVLGVSDGRSASQLADGLHSGLPVTCALLADRLPGLVRAFAAEDVWERRPLGRRFASWLVGKASDEVVSLVEYEAGLCHLPAAESDRVGLGGLGEGGYRLAEGVQLLRTPVDVVELVRSVDFGDVVLQPDLSVQDVDGARVPREPHSVVLVRGLDGQPAVVDVDEPTADALERLVDGGSLHVDDAMIDALVEHMVLAPTRWSL